MAQEIKSQERQQLEKEFLNLVQREDVQSHILSNFFAKKNPTNISQFTTNIINQAHTSSGFFALHLAITNNNLIILNFLLFNGANVNIKTKNTAPTTALQLSIHLRKINCAMTLTPHCDVNQLTAKEYSNLALQLIDAEEFSFLKNLFQKTNISLKKEALRELKINKQYCLLYARSLKDRKLFNLLLEHGTDPFYNYASFFSARKSVFMDAITEKNIADAAHMLLSQEKISDFKYILDFLNICTKKQDQYALIDKVLEKVTPEAKQKALLEWVIDEEYCLLHAYKNDKDLFDILLKHGADAFYQKTLSAIPSAFKAAVENNDINAAFKMLMAQQKDSISQFGSGFSLIPKFLSQCIAQSDKEKIKTVIPHLEKAVGNQFALTQTMSWHTDEKGESLTFQALKNGMPEFVDLVTTHLWSYNRYINERHICYMVRKNYMDLAYKALKSNERKTDISYELWINHQTKIVNFLTPIIEQNHSNLFLLIIQTDNFWVRSVKSYAKQLALIALYHSFPIFKCIIEQKPGIITKPVSEGKKLIAIAAECNKEAYDFLYQKHIAIGDYDIPLFIGKIRSTSLVEDYTQIETRDLQQPSDARSAAQITAYLQNNNDQLTDTTTSVNITCRNPLPTGPNNQHFGNDSPVKSGQHTYKDNPEEFYSPENEF